MKQSTNSKIFFFKSWFQISPQVFRPRPETEQLIGETNIFFNSLIKKKNPAILEIGTGSGVISISLAKLFPEAKITAIDVSDKAIVCAQKNAQENKVEIRFLKSDLFENIKNKEKFDLIISNPPYIADDYPLDESVKKNDPKVALYGGIDGLVIIKKIISEAPTYLNKKFLIAIEIGFDQGEKISYWVEENYPKFQCFIKKDYNQHDRFLFLYSKN